MNEKWCPHKKVKETVTDDKKTPSTRIMTTVCQDCGRTWKTVAKGGKG